MPKKSATKLTDKFLENAAPTANRQEIADAIVTGLYFLVQPTGKKGWAVRYLINKKPAKFTLGAYPALSLRNARDAAKEVLKAVAEGRDPAVEKVATKAAEEKAADDTVNAILDVYYKVELSKQKQKSIDETERALDKELRPILGDRPITTIKRRDVRKVTNAILERGAPVMANRVHAMACAFFAWAATTEDYGFDVSPLANAPYPFQEESRDRVLTNEELRLVWLGAEKVGWPYGPVVQLLILTAQRKMEVGAASWKEFKMEGNRMLWTIPKERCKNGREQNLFLPHAVMKLFEAQPKIAGVDGNDFIFTSRGKVPVWSYSAAKNDLDAAMLAIAKEEAAERGEDPEAVKAIPHWTLHDLRRTATTHLAALKVLPFVTEALLNHKSGTIKGVAAIYNRFEYIEEKFEAMELWVETVQKIVRGEAVSNVIAFRKAG